jgi:hypothetical protein
MVRPEDLCPDRHAAAAEWRADGHLCLCMSAELGGDGGNRRDFLESRNTGHVSGPSGRRSDFCSGAGMIESAAAGSWPDRRRSEVPALGLNAAPAIRAQQGACRRQ